MAIQKTTIPMDNPFDQGRCTIEEPQREGMIMSKKKSKISAKTKIPSLL
jgi:hypothetical protein